MHVSPGSSDLILPGTERMVLKSHCGMDSSFASVLSCRVLDMLAA
jgi:hypothetical protein